jgi:hypothetical protein
MYLSGRSGVGDETAGAFAPGSGAGAQPKSTITATMSRGVSILI